MNFDQVDDGSTEGGRPVRSSIRHLTYRKKQISISFNFTRHLIDKHPIRLSITAYVKLTPDSRPQKLATFPATGRRRRSLLAPASQRRLPTGLARSRRFHVSS